MSNTLLSHIVRRFAPGRHEDLATEALAHVLQQSSAARQALARLASELVGRPIEVRRVTTQLANATSASRPDLVAFDSEGARTVLIEAKFAAGLTDNQPHEYLKETDGLVLVLCPPRRIQPLWPELRRRCEQVGEVEDRPPAPATRSAAVTGAAVLALTTWDSLIGQLRAAVAVEDPGSLGDVDQLAALCAVFEADAFMPLSSEELTADTGRRIRQFIGLVDDLRSYALELPDVDKKGLGPGLGAGWSGHYLNLPRGWYGFLHFSAYKWSAHAPTPIWIWLRDRVGGNHNPSAVQTVLDPLWGGAQQPHLDDGQWQVPLHPPTGADRDAVFESLRQQLDAVLELIRRRTDQESP